VDLWGIVAAVAALLAAALAVALHRRVRTGRLLRARISGLEAQVTALHRAVHEQQAARRELVHRAVHDPLTGLPNRSYLADRLDEALPEGALLLLHLDGLVETWDALGQDVGDDVLLEVTRRLRGAVRHIDTVARLGVEEFAVLLPDATQQRARLSAIKMLDTLRPPYRSGDHRIRLTPSIGILADGEQTAAEALRDADLALSAARRGGKDRLAEFHQELREDRLRTSRLAAGLRLAIEADELTLHYQPIVSMATGSPVAIEALARWSPAGADPIPPTLFIPVAEQTGLVVPLGARILREACTQGRPWYERYGTSISVNVSGRQLMDSHFADYVLAVLGETGLPGGALILEITETVMVAATGPDGLTAITQLERLRAHGVRVAIDDFGTGYSSLSYLHRLPIDILKIDGEFIRALDEPAAGPGVPARGSAGIGTGRALRISDPEQRGDRETTFAHAILRLGMSLHLTTIAEGVETPHQADMLRSMGCPLAQGFWFATPGPADEIDAYLHTSRQRVPA
jgi:diguanylate cyclase (GGDEF)-like protein